MKRTNFTLILFCLIFGIGTLHAQVIFEENFDYDANRPLIMDPIASVANLDPVTGWSTTVSTSANVNTFNITDAPLIYNGYALSGIGNALKYNGNAGQTVFKLFSKTIKNDSTVYISFLINFPDVSVTGGDWFMGIRMEPSASSSNYGSKVWALVAPEFPGEEISLGINKIDNTPVWTDNNTFFAANMTHLFVLKYHVGTLVGNTAADEAGKYDDVMSLYVDPQLNGVEPATPVLIHNDPNVKDIYRNLTTGGSYGGACGLMLRSSATGNIPAYTIDGIRVGLNWADVIPATDGLKVATANNFTYKLQNRTIILSASTSNYNRYELLTLSGQRILAGTLVNNDNQIDVSGLTKGIYILNLEGNQHASVKIALR